MSLPIFASKNYSSLSAVGKISIHW